MKKLGGGIDLRYFFFALALGLSACSLSPRTSSEQATPTLSLIQFQTPTPSETSLPGPGSVPLASPTPLLYTVVANDTFFAIADRFKITIQALETANPGVNPRVLIPGTSLVIPLNGETVVATALPTLTPVAAQNSSPLCYSTAAGELWCFLLVSNDEEQTIENPSGLIDLLAADGSVVGSAQAVAPLDILPAGEQMPLVAYFADPPSNWVAVRGQILTGFWLSASDETYLAVKNIDFDWTESSSDAKTAHVQGTVSLSSDKKAQSVWVLAVAYDATGLVVGTRRWESSGDLDFDFWVYSLGPEIADVQVLTEVRP